MPPPKRSSSSISSNTGDALSDEDYGAFKANPSRTLFFRDLPFHYRDNHLRSMVLSLLGAHEEDPRYNHLLCRVKFSKEDGKTLQIGLVQFNSMAEVDLVLSALVSNKRFDGRDVSAFPFSVNSGNRPSKDGSIQFSFKCDSDEPLITEGLVRQYLEAKYGLLKSISIRGHFSLKPAGQDGYGFLSFETTQKDMSFLRSTSRATFDRDGFRLIFTFRQVISKQASDSQVPPNHEFSSPAQAGEQAAATPGYKAEINRIPEQQLPASYRVNLPERMDHPMGAFQSAGHAGFPAPPQLSLVIPPYQHAQYGSNTLQPLAESASYGHPQPSYAPIPQQEVVYSPQPSSSSSTGWVSHVQPNSLLNAQYNAAPTASAHQNGQYMYPLPIMTASSSSSSFGEPMMTQQVLYGESMSVPSPTNFSVWSSSSSSPASSIRQYVPAAAPVMYYNYSPRNLPGPQVHQYVSQPLPPPPHTPHPPSSSQHFMPPSSNYFHGSSPRSGPQVFPYVAAAPSQHILQASTQTYSTARPTFMYPSHPHFVSQANVDDPYSSVGAGQPINRSA